MHEDYRDVKIKELRDQLTRFAPKAKKVEQAALPRNCMGRSSPIVPMLSTTSAFGSRITGPRLRVGTASPRPI